MKPFISGIQQIGIGNPDVRKAFEYYRKNLSMDIPVFDEAAEANLMLPYTGGKPRSRHAILALNLQGGGGLELWQYTSRVSQPPKEEIKVGDIGIFIAKYKTRDVDACYLDFKEKGVQVIGNVHLAPDGREHFYFKDTFGNWGEIVQSDDWFTNRKDITGGVYGCCIGVRDMNKSLGFYDNILGYDIVIDDKTDNFVDLLLLNGGMRKMRRVLLTHSKPRKGAFSKLLGRSEIELFQVVDEKPKVIFEDRLWGDMGYIHLCYDINGMAEMKAKCEAAGHPFTVDSAESFDMGEAAGHFAYIEDPDGTLIEFVETHKVPILKKIGWYLNLKNRNPEKPLPDWMVKALGFGRIG